MTLMKSLIATDEIERLKKNDEILEDNMKKLWNYLNLLTNGRDMIKSIIYYLYKYFELHGQTNTYDQLSKILEKLKSDALNNKLIANNSDNNNNPDMTKEKLNQFLLLSFFLKNFLNKALHREFQLDEIIIDNNDNNSLKFIPKTSFDSFFKNLEYFIEKTVNENEIQLLISTAINDYIKDKDLKDELKYQPGKIFKNSIIEGKNYFESVVKKEDINNMFNFLKSIKFNGEDFAKLCNDKLWKSKELKDEIEEE